MVFISLLLRAWMVQMTSLHAVPRTLADDLMVLTSGSRALHLFKRALIATMSHLFDLGGKLAAKKSKLFSTMGVLEIMVGS